MDDISSKVRNISSDYLQEDLDCQGQRMCFFKWIMLRRFSA